MQYSGENHSAAAILLAAPSSGQGKSIITAGLARLYRDSGRRVRVFKHGPDYLDPMLLEQASGAPVYQLHPWMTGVAESRRRLAAAVEQAEVVLVEGAMGLYDGSPSSADLAALLGLPVAVVINAKAMAETFGAIVSGLANYRDDISFHGALANRVDSRGHAEMLRKSMPAGVTWMGAVPNDDSLAIADRHLGLVQAGELGDLDKQLTAAATVLAEAGLGELPPTVHFTDPEPASPPPGLLVGKRIGVALDQAFAFVYRGNLELLEAMGAELVYFSPLADDQLPLVDAVWLPGGYPELHAAELAANDTMLQALREHHRAGKPILAECGGLMYCATELEDNSGACHTMLGLLPGRAVMTERLVGLGLQSWEEDGEQLRGHTFHYSRFESAPAPLGHTTRRSGGAAEAVYRKGTLTAAYFHGYFPSAPQLVARLFCG